MTSRSRPVDWDAQPLGVVPDAELARQLNVAVSRVVRARLQRKIPAVEWPGVGPTSRVGPDGYKDVMVRLPIEAWQELSRRARKGRGGGVAGQVRKIVMERLEEEDE